MCIGVSNVKYSIFIFLNAKFDIDIDIYIKDGLMFGKRIEIERLNHVHGLETMGKFSYLPFKEAYAFSR